MKIIVLLISRARGLSSAWNRQICTTRGHRFRERFAHFKVLQYPRLGMLQYLISQTGFPWDADFINLKAYSLPSPRCDRISHLPQSPVPSPLRQRNNGRPWTTQQSGTRALTCFRRRVMRWGLTWKVARSRRILKFAQNMNLGFTIEMVRQAEEHEREIAWRVWPTMHHHLLPQYLMNNCINKRYSVAHYSEENHQQPPRRIHCLEQRTWVRPGLLLHMMHVLSVGLWHLRVSPSLMLLLRGVNALCIVCLN